MINKISKQIRYFFNQNIFNQKDAILHVMHNDKFNKEFVEFINKEFVAEEHIFVFYGGCLEKQFPIPKFKNVIKLERYGVKEKNKNTLLLKLIKNSRKIILHGLFNESVIILLDENHNLLSKCSWVIWGGDLYHYKYRDKTPKENNFEEIRQRVIGGFSEFITETKGDYDLATKWYFSSAKWACCFVYPSNFYKKYKINLNDLKNKKSFGILVGNSAADENNHIEIFHKLDKHKTKISKVICPLSYCYEGDYRENVIREGKKIFDDKFVFILEYMEKTDYENMLLNEIDIAIFNHERQQAFGNITTLLSMGKKVYLHKKSTLVETFSKKGLKIFLTQNLDQNSFFDLEEKNILNNIEKMREKFSITIAIQSLKSIFNSKH